MLYEFDLTIPANTPASAPVSILASLAPGRVSQVSVTFPAGCIGLVHAYIVRSMHQVWPTNPGEQIKGDGQSVTWPEDYNLDDDPFTFTCYGYNLDDTYAHTLTFRFALLGGAPRAVTPQTTTLLDRLRELIRA